MTDYSYMRHLSGVQPRFTIYEGLEDLNKMFKRHVAGYENFLASRCGRKNVRLQLPAVKEGSFSLRYKFICGRRTGNTLMAPAYYVRITYKRNSDKYDVESGYIDGWANLAWKMNFAELSAVELGDAAKIFARAGEEKTGPKVKTTREEASTHIMNIVEETLQPRVIDVGVTLDWQTAELSESMAYLAGIKKPPTRFTEDNNEDVRVADLLDETYVKDLHHMRMLADIDRPAYLEDRRSPDIVEVERLTKLVCDLGDVAAAGQLAALIERSPNKNLMRNRLVVDGLIHAGQVNEHAAPKVSKLLIQHAYDRARVVWNQTIHSKQLGQIFNEACEVLRQHLGCDTFRMIPPSGDPSCFDEVRAFFETDTSMLSVRLYCEEKPRLDFSVASIQGWWGQRDRDEAVANIAKDLRIESDSIFARQVGGMILEMAKSARAVAERISPLLPLGTPETREKDDPPSATVHAAGGVFAQEEQDREEQAQKESVALPMSAVIRQLTENN